MITLFSLLFLASPFLVIGFALRKSARGVSLRDRRRS